MNADVAIDLGREAVTTSLMLVGPVLLVGIVAAIIIGVIQAMTQIQDQAVSFIPRLVLIVVAILVCLPWITERFVDYGSELYARPQFLNLRTTELPDESGW